MINQPEHKNEQPLCTCGKTQNQPYCDGSCDIIDEDNDSEDDKHQK